MYRFPEVVGRSVEIDFLTVFLTESGLTASRSATSMPLRDAMVGQSICQTFTAISSNVCAIAFTQCLKLTVRFMQFGPLAAISSCSFTLVPGLLTALVSVSHQALNRHFVHYASRQPFGFGCLLFQVFDSIHDPALAFYDNLRRIASFRRCFILA